MPDPPALSPLLTALYSRRADVVDQLLATGPTLDVFEAAAVGRVDRLEEMLAGDPSLARVFSVDGFTALHLAGFFGQPEAARLLLHHGADASAVARNDMSVTPLHSALAGPEPGIGRMLVEAGAAVNARQQGGFTALHEAALNGDSQMVELLLARGAEVGAADDGRTPAHMAAAGGHTELAARLA